MLWQAADASPGRRRLRPGHTGAPVSLLRKAIFCGHRGPGGSPAVAVHQVQQVGRTAAAGAVEEVAGVEVRILDEDVLVQVDGEIVDDGQDLADVDAGPAGRVDARGD